MVSTTLSDITIYQSHWDTRWYLPLTLWHNMISTTHTVIQHDIYHLQCDTTWYLPLTLWHRTISTTHIVILDDIHHSHCDTRWYLPLASWYMIFTTQRHYDLALTGWHSWRRYAVIGTVAWHFHEAAEQTHCPGAPSQQPPGSYPPCRGPVVAMSAPSSEPSRSAALTPARKCRDWWLIHNTFKMLQLATHSQHLQNAAISEPFTTPSKCYDWWLIHTFRMLQLVIRSQRLQNAMICNSFTKASKCSYLQLIHNTFKMLWLETRSQHRWNAKVSYVSMLPRAHRICNVPIHKISLTCNMYPQTCRQNQSLYRNVKKKHPCPTPPTHRGPHPHPPMQHTHQIHTHSGSHDHPQLLTCSTSLASSLSMELLDVVAHFCVLRTTSWMSMLHNTHDYGCQCYTKYISMDSRATESTPWMPVLLK